MKKQNNQKFNNIIKCVEELNETISTDETLGKGFRIGHSYFCSDEPLSEVRLNAIVEFELIPLLNEYWFDEPSSVMEWSEKLRSAIR